jgi:hypothetical protein
MYRRDDGPQPTHLKKLVYLSSLNVSQTSRKWFGFALLGGLNLGSNDVLVLITVHDLIWILFINDQISNSGGKANPKGGKDKEKKKS